MHPTSWAQAVGHRCHHHHLLLQPQHMLSRQPAAACWPAAGCRLRAATTGGDAPTGWPSTTAFEADRLLRDQQARSAMVSKAAADAAAEEAAPGSKEGAWKWRIRKQVWDFMEENDIARFPRPPHHRIPNYDGAERAAERLATLPEWRAASCCKVNPDRAQAAVRFEVLAGGKTLLTPQPRLRTGFFSTLTRADLPRDSSSALSQACTSAGVAKFGRPISLDDCARLQVDLIVVGSTAVCPSSGARLGKGEGFAELEYGILAHYGAVTRQTPVITLVHDCQVLEPGTIDPSLMLEHDVPVDIIITPTRVIRTNTTLPRPRGILWHKLSSQKLSQIRVLRELKHRIEQETGQVLPSGPDEVLPPLAERKQLRRGRGGGEGGRGRRGGGGQPRGSGGREAGAV